MKKYILILTIALTILLASCNSEGSGIFFQISQEVKQITSPISELAVHQVVEVGANVYARTGRKVWVKDGSTWTDVTKGNYIYNIVEEGGVLYGNINNDDVNLNGGKIMSYTIGNWSLVANTNYGTDITLFEVDGKYLLLKDTSDILLSISNIANASFLATSLSGMKILDGASGDDDLIISSNSIYGTDFTLLPGTPLTLSTEPTNPDGDYCGLATNGTNMYLSTSTGYIYSKIAGVWGLAGNITDDIPTPGSLEVVTISTKEYLIIGTNNGYYEMNITDSGSVVEPTQTTSVLDFDTSYPELATELVFEVYSTAADVIYLSTSKGLWKRNADGTFSKQ